jgi:hypothetical protein
MAPTTTVTHGRSHADGYGLTAIAEHNAAEQFPPYAEDTKRLGIHVSISCRLSIPTLCTDSPAAPRWVRSSLPGQPRLCAKPTNTKPERWRSYEKRSHNQENRLAIQHEQVQDVDVAHRQNQAEEEKQARPI